MLVGTNYQVTYTHILMSFSIRPLENGMTDFMSEVDDLVSVLLRLINTGYRRLYNNYWPNDP